MKRSMGRAVAAFAAPRVCGAILLWAFGAQIAFAQAPAEIETTMQNMLAAARAHSLPDFVAAGDPAFKAGVTGSMFDSVSGQLAPRLNQGYTMTFLGSLNQQGYSVYLWKLVFKDGKDDRLVTMAMKDGKVGGFYLR